MAQRIKCERCGRDYHDSLIGQCGTDLNKTVCMYCCRKCENSYTVPGQIGQRCKAKEAAREAKKGKGKSE